MDTAHTADRRVRSRPGAATAARLVGGAVAGMRAGARHEHRQQVRRVASVLSVLGLREGIAARLINGFFLGFVLQAGATTHGWEDTARLTAVHVPLEVLAWLVTLWCSVLLADLAGRAWYTRERPARHQVVQLVRAGVVATVFYLVAAGAEWFELWLVVRGGNPA